MPQVEEFNSVKLTDRITAEPRLASVMSVFFYLNGHFTQQNCRYWSTANPILLTEKLTQYIKRIHFRAGLLGDAIIFPLLQGNLICERYADMIELEDQRQFQQEGAPFHYVFPVLDNQWLDNHYQNHLIVRTGSVEGSPRFPDLSPLDLFLWGNQKSVVCETQPESVEQHQERIIQESRAISRQTFVNLRQ